MAGVSPSGSAAGSVCTTLGFIHFRFNKLRKRASPVRSNWNTGALLSINLFIRPSNLFVVRAIVNPSFHACVRISIYPSDCLLIHLFIRPSIGQSAHPHRTSTSVNFCSSIRPSIHSSIRPSIRLLVPLTRANVLIIGNGIFQRVVKLHRLSTANSRPTDRPSYTRTLPASTKRRRTDGLKDDGRVDRRTDKRTGG